MAFAGKWRKRSMPRRKRPAYRKRVYRKRPLGMSTVYKYTRMGQDCIIQNSTTAGNITTNNGSIITLGSVAADTVGSQFPFAMSFSASQVQGIGEFTGLYDQYRIRGVKLTIIPLSDTAQTNTAGFLPTMFIHPDYDDASLASYTYVGARERQGVKCVRLVKPFSMFIRPKAVLDISSGGATGAAAAIVRPGWIDCNDTASAHYGIKAFMKNVDLRAQPGCITAFRIETKYYLEFKGAQ